MRMTVDSHLAGKGFRKVSSGGDVMVGYQITTKDQVSYKTVGNAWGGMGWSRGGGWGMGAATTRQLKELNRRSVRLTTFASLAMVCLLVFVFGIPSGSWTVQCHSSVVAAGG